MRWLPLVLCGIIGSFALLAQTNQADSVSVADFGIQGDGQTELSDTIQYVLDHYAHVYFPAGNYLLNKSLHLRSYHQLRGSDSTVFIPADNSHFSFFSAKNTRHVRLEQLSFYAQDEPERTVFAVFARNVHHIALVRLNAYNCGVAKVLSSSDFPNYADIPDDLSSAAFERAGNTHVSIDHCRGIGSKKSSARHTAGVLLAYTNHWKVTHSSFSRYDHGVQWWGGDSNPERDGDIAKVRKCQDGTVEQVSVHQVRGGGIWGSMGENITVKQCHVTQCGDVGIDFEGCFRSRATDNYVAESNNGNLAVFHLNKDIVFANNRLVQSNPNQPLACIYNASQSQNNGQVVFDNNSFMATRGVGLIRQQGPSRRIIFTQNSLHNVTVNFSFNNNHYIDVSNNVFLITRPLENRPYILRAGQTHRGGEVVIARNHLRSTVSQSDTTYAISIHQSDYNASPTNRIVHNTISGLPRMIEVQWAGKNAGFAAKTYIQSEYDLPTDAIRRIEQGARSSELRVNGKKIR